MDFQRGERVNLNFDTGAVEKLDTDNALESSLPAFPSFVGDILERDSRSTSPPVAPSLKANVNGFPAPKKRTPRVSAFKQQRAVKEKASKPSTQDAPPPRAAVSSVEQEKQSIDQENQQRLAAMSEAEIEQERQELMQSLNPALLQKLLARSNIEQGSNEEDFNLPGSEAHAAKKEDRTKPASTKKVSFAPSESTESEAAPQPLLDSATSTSAQPPSSTVPTEAAPTEPTDSIHFPTTSQPTLDPSDPNFLESLHTKYFPDLSHDPSKLSWMTPIDPNDTTSPYHPSHSALNASDLRFDFNGSLLAPSVARSIPTDRGLHHHADAPEAAGYTIPELSLLARSAVASQRCMAYQTIGRILFRLGQGEFGIEKSRRDENKPVRVMQNPDAAGDGDDEDDEEEEDVGSAMAAGLWTCIEKGLVIETLTEEANKSKGHLSARTLAQEALWNWRRGGGRKRAAI